MKKFLPLIFAAMLMCVPSYSQDGYMMEIKNDTKIIHTSELGMPGSSTLGDVLSMLPEILGRPKVDVLSDYDIQIGGFSLGADREAALTMIHVADMKKIEITESAVDNYVNNGQGGTIKITLNDAEEGLTGSVDLTAYSIPQVSPNMILSYKKGKFYARGLFGLGGFMSYDYRIDSKYIYPNNTYTASDTTTYRQGIELAHIFMQYKPNDADTYELQISQSYGKQSVNVNGEKYEYEVKRMLDEDMHAENLDLSAEAKYEHVFVNKSKLTVKGNYSGKPINKSSKESMASDAYSKDRYSKISGKVEYLYKFLDSNGGEKGNVCVGLNANTGNSKRDYNEILNYFGLVRYSHNVNTTGNTSFLSPYARAEAAFGKFRVKAIAEYEYYHQRTKSEHNETHDSYSNDFVCKLMLGWQFTSHQHLRLILDRKIKRPTDEQLYPYLLYRPDPAEYFKGNAALKPEQIHEIGLDYISDRKTASGLYLMGNASVNFIRVDDRIRTVVGGTIVESEFPYDFMTYVNKGFNNIINTNLMFYLRKGIFSLSLTGNLYMNYDVQDSVTDHYNYYSLALYPLFNFKNDWKASVLLTYHSPVSRKDASLGQSASSLFYVGKTWGGFSAGLSAQLQIINRTTDITNGANNLVIEENYQPGYRFVGLNLNYRF